jgi:hypothetical protein
MSVVVTYVVEWCHSLLFRVQYLSLIWWFTLKPFWKNDTNQFLRNTKQKKSNADVIIHVKSCYLLLMNNEKSKDYSNSNEITKDITSK